MEASKFIKKDIDILTHVCYSCLNLKKCGVAMEKEKRRKTKTSSEVKARYNAKTYTRIQLNVRKATANAYKEKCKQLGISCSDPLHKAIAETLDKK